MMTFHTGEMCRKLRSVSAFRANGAGGFVQLVSAANIFIYFLSPFDMESGPGNVEERVDWLHKTSYAAAYRLRRVVRRGSIE